MSMNKCSAWRPGDDFFPGDYDRCYATKEADACSCQGNEAFCDFYPEKRKAAVVPAVGTWINAKDCLPEDCIDKSKDIKNIKVLVAIKAKNGWTVRTQMRCKNVHYRYFGADPEISWYWRHSAGDVTHWMPLPEAPKEDFNG